MNLKSKRTTINNLLLENIKRNKKEYISLCIALFIGVVLGIMFINNVKDNEKLQIQEYINSFIEILKNKSEIDNSTLLKESITRNIISGVSLWFIGSTVIGIPLVYAHIVYKGFCISYTISSCIAVLGQAKGIIFSIASILFQNILVIPAILTISVSGIKLYKSIMQDRRKENIKLEIIRHTIISIISILCLIVAAILETFISTNILEIVIKYI